jgi:hypothetical protein
MRKMLLLLAMGAGLASPGFMIADSGCYDGATTPTYTCSSKVPKCSLKITVTEPGPEVGPCEDGDFYVETSSIYCCGLYIGNWTYGGGCTGASELRSPQVRERLAEISQTTDILMADSAHRYVTLERQPDGAVDASLRPYPPRAASRYSNAISSQELEDRILR